jgi:hypothetical protein
LYHGLKGSNEASFILDEYFTKKSLAEIGYRFDPSDLELWKVEAFLLIAKTLNNEEKKDLKKKAKNGK